MKSQIELKCNICKQELNCVCTSFMVHVCEEGLEVECLKCRYKKLEIREAELDYCRRRLEHILMSKID